MPRSLSAPWIPQIIPLTTASSSWPEVASQTYLAQSKQTQSMDSLKYLNLLPLFKNWGDKDKTSHFWLLLRKSNCLAAFHYIRAATHQSWVLAAIAQSIIAVLPKSSSSPTLCLLLSISCPHSMSCYCIYNLFLSIYVPCLAYTGKRIHQVYFRPVSIIKWYPLVIEPFLLPPSAACMLSLPHMLFSLYENCFPSLHCTITALG